MGSVSLHFYRLTRFCRLLFSVASLVALILLVLVFPIQFLPLPKTTTPPALHKYQWMVKMESTTYSILEPLRKSVPTNYTFKGSRDGEKFKMNFEFSALIAFVVLMLLRAFILGNLSRLEEYAKERARPRARPIPKKVEPTVRLQPTTKDHVFEGEGVIFHPADRGGGTKAKLSMRLTLMQEISKAKMMLETTKKYLAFLSVDVVGSTQLKAGEDSVNVGSTFLAYKRFIESILGRRGVWKQAWTPDGLMAAFPNLSQAVSAGQEILRRLDDFNKHENQLKSPFTLRLGVHGGEVYFDESDKLEEVSDHAIDVAGHLQKGATINGLWTTPADMPMLEDKGGFRQIGKKIEGYNIFEWTVAGRVGELLIEDGLISQDDLNKALEEQKRSPRPLGQILIDRRVIEEADFLKVLGKQLRVATINVDPHGVDIEALRRVPKELAERFSIFPISFRNRVLEIVSDFLIEVQHLNELEGLLGVKIDQEAIASRKSIQSAIDQGYRRLQGTRNQG